MIDNTESHSVRQTLGARALDAESFATTIALRKRLTELGDEEALSALRRFQLDIARNVGLMVSDANKAVEAATASTRELMAERANSQRLANELAAKTTALREISRADDPAHVERRTQEVVARAVAQRDERIRELEELLAVSNRELAEVRASKRKQKEAYERLKNNCTCQGGRR